MTNAATSSVWWSVATAALPNVKQKPVRIWRPRPYEVEDLVGPVGTGVWRPGPGGHHMDPVSGYDGARPCQSDQECQ